MNALDSNLITKVFPFQVEYGDLKLSSSDYSEGAIYQANIAQQVSTVLDRFYPKKFTHVPDVEQRSVSRTK